jgi:hypothetical protein
LQYDVEDVGWGQNFALAVNEKDGDAKDEEDDKDELLNYLEDISSTRRRYQ